MNPRFVVITAPNDQYLINLNDIVYVEKETKGGSGYLAIHLSKNIDIKLRAVIKIIDNIFAGIQNALNSDKLVYEINGEKE